MYRQKRKERKEKGEKKEVEAWCEVWISAVFCLPAILFFFFKQHKIGLIWHSLGAGLPLSLTFVERGDEGMKLWKTTFRLICIERARFLIGCIHKNFAYRVATQVTQVWDESR